MSDYKIGDKVRSYDFAGSKNHYVEGTIRAIGPIPCCGRDCQHYHIEIERTVWGDLNRKNSPGCFVYPALNYSTLEKI